MTVWYGRDDEAAYERVITRLERQVETVQAALYGSLRHWRHEADAVSRVDVWTLDGFPNVTWTVRLYESTRAVTLLANNTILVTLYNTGPERVLNVLREFGAPVDAPVDGAL